MNQSSAESEPTVFVVDDDEDMRHALRWLIESAGLPVKLFRTAEEFLENHCAEREGCLLLDLRMPGMGGLSLLEKIQSQDGPTLPTIILTGHGDVPTAVKALKAGAIDFVEKPAIERQLLDRIQEALASDRTRRKQIEEITSIRRALHALTEREREVLDAVVAGESSKCIALRLGISERTVETFRRNIKKKTRVTSLAALVQLAVQQGRTDHVGSAH